LARRAASPCVLIGKSMAKDGGKPSEPQKPRPHSLYVPNHAYNDRMFRIKICGITSAADAAHAARAGADAVGLNFFAGCKRCVTQPQAAEILAALPRGVTKVGVFVNEEAGVVCRTCDQLGLDWIQLHGDEPPGYLAGLGGRAVLRALRLDEAAMGPAAQFLADCRRLGTLPQAVLVDTHAPGQFGGTGQPFNWDLLTGQTDWLGGLPLVLAGGLTPDNVADAIRRVHPAAVDTASGVERSPGVKEPGLVAAFVRAAEMSFGR